MIQTAGLLFNKNIHPIHFLAVDLNTSNLAATLTNYILIPANACHPNNYDRLEKIIQNGKRILLDSGIFNLLMEHSKKHKLDFNQALGLQPTEIDGFDKLWIRYIDLLQKFDNQTWGYIEMDVGGKETKTRMRTKLESIGFHPIPVYHPINDGWDYFDYLAENYDRVCVGNISQADTPMRLRIIATIWQRKQKFPGLWIHLLGYSLNEWANAYPCESSDSSSWLGSAKYPDGFTERADGRAIGPIFRDFQYNLLAEQEAKNGITKGKRLASYMDIFQELNLRSHQKEEANTWEKLSIK